MSIEKCTSIILSTTPFRESSLLLYLFTREHGRIHALAKGIRKGDRRGVPVERGYLIEHMTYMRPHRDLQQVTDCHIREHFPAIRGDLEKTAVRDVLFDLALGAIKVTDPHPELFDYMAGFLGMLERMCPGGGALLLHLSKMIFGFAGHLGVGVDFSGCGRCGKSFGEHGTAWLTIDRGMVRCDDCSPTQARTDRFLPGSIAAFFGCFGEPDSFPPPRLTDKESMGVLRLACEYCRYHLDIRRHLESLSFIEQLLAPAASTAKQR